MNELLLALLAGVPNPFAVVRVDSAWDEPPGDVPALGAAALAACRRLVGEVRSSGRSHGLLVSGQPGTGKTHLLTRFRQWVVESESGWFVSVPPVTSPDRFWRHLLRHLAADILRVPRRGGVTQLETAVAHHMMADATASAEATARFWQLLRLRYAPGLELHEHLQGGVLEPLAERLGLHGGVTRALAAHLAGVNRLEARDYLLGGSLAEHALAALGATETLDDETPAEAAVGSLLRLASPALVAVFAFDQIEGLQRRPDDVEPLLGFGHGLDALLRASDNVAVLTCAMVSFLATLRAAIGEALYDGRIAETQTSLQPLDGVEAVTLVSDRLRRSMDLQTLRYALKERQVVDVADPCWPLSGSWVGALAERRVESARTILKHCKIELEQRAAALAAQPVPAAPPTPSAGQVLESALETAIAEWSDATTPLDEGVYEDGLLRAFQIEARAGTRVIAAPERDIDLVLERPAGRVAVSLCNASNMVSLAGRLRRLVALADQGRYQRIVWLRDQRLALKPTARAVHDYAGQLRERGCGVVAAPAEAYAALAAIRALLADAAAGDLQAGERPIAVAELSTWLAQRLPVPVRDLLDAIGGAESTVEIAGLDALHELLQGECLLELADAAARSGVPAAVAREAALLRPEVIGYLAGPPEVLFLQPGGLVRS